MLTGNRGKNWNRGKPIGWVTGEPGKSIQPGSRENKSNRGAGEMAATGEMAHAPVKRRAEILGIPQGIPLGESPKGIPEGNTLGESPRRVP